MDMVPVGATVNRHALRMGVSPRIFGSPSCQAGYGPRVFARSAEASSACSMMNRIMLRPISMPFF